MECNNNQDTWVPGMCYVPWQRWQKIYEPGPALACGTLFPILNKPFTGGCRW